MRRLDFADYNRIGRDGLVEIRNRLCRILHVHFADRRIVARSCDAEILARTYGLNRCGFALGELNVCRIAVVIYKVGFLPLVELVMPVCRICKGKVFEFRSGAQIYGLRRT